MKLKINQELINELKFYKVRKASPIRQTLVTGTSDALISGSCLLLWKFASRLPWSHRADQNQMLSGVSREHKNEMLFKSL